MNWIWVMTFLVHFFSTWHNFILEIIKKKDFKRLNDLIVRAQTFKWKHLARCCKQILIATGCKICILYYFGVDLWFFFLYETKAGDNHHFHPTCARCSKCGDPFGDGEEMYLQVFSFFHTSICFVSLLNISQELQVTQFRYHAHHAALTLNLKWFIS